MFITGENQKNDSLKYTKEVLQLNLKGKLHDDLKNFIVKVGWTHKIHIVQSDRLFAIANVIKVIQVIAVAITASGLLATVNYRFSNFL